MKKIVHFFKRRVAIPTPGEFQENRGRIIFIALCALYSAVFVRAVFLQIIPLSNPSLAYMADHQYEQDLAIAPDRGAIFDRKGEPFAISIKKDSLAMNPAAFSAKEKIPALARILKVPRSKLRKDAKKKGYFAWLKRKMSRSQASRIEALGDIRGLHFISEPARYYPVGSVGAHLIGLVGMDNNGLMGLEKELESDLKGKTLQLAIHKDGRQRAIFLHPGGIKPEQTGNNVYLTIDRPIQEITEKALQAGVKEAGAKKGFAIVSDPHTGKILAMANYPSFNPNHFRRTDLASTYNQALNNLFEPGSVTKPLVVAGALDRGTIKANDKFYCENGTLKIGRNRIRDTKPHKLLSTPEILVFSSNICTYKVAQSMSEKGTYDTLKQFGIGSRETKLGLGGEQRGKIGNYEKWREIRFANIAFGQGFMTTGMEIVTALSTIANGGNLVKPMLVERVETSSGKVLSSNSSQVIRRVIKPKTAASVRGMMQQVVEHERGSGRRALNDFYTVAGKTGTAQKIDPGHKGYSATRRTASFVGFAPVNDPYIIIYVVIDEPTKKPYYGGRWAAPVVKEIVVNTLRYLNVPQDKGLVAQKDLPKSAGVKKRL